MYTVKFDTGKAKNLRMGSGATIKSFTMREVNGQDEEVASSTSKAKGGAATSAEELVRLSIVEVNGEPVKHPYLAFDTWNSRARAYALQAFRSLNSATDDELEGFLAAAQPQQEDGGGSTPSTSGGVALANG